MRVIRPACVLAALLLPATLGAQTVRPAHSVFSITVYGGGSALSDLQRQDLHIFGAEGEGIVADQTIAAEPAAVAGIAATVWPSRYWGVRLHAAYGATDVAAERNEPMPGAPPHTADGGSDLRLWLYDVTAVLRAPHLWPETVAPYAVLGVGAVAYRLSASESAGPPRWMVSDEESRTRLAGIVGLGVAVPMRQDGFSLAFELTDHFTGTPIESRRGWLSADEAAVEHEPTRDAGSATREVSIVNQIRFSVGITYSM